MKKLILYSFIFLSSYFGYSQSYHRLVQDSAIYIQCNYCLDNGIPTGFTFDKYLLLGDTTIQNLDYKKLYYSPFSQNPYLTNFQPIGALREDSLHRVFFYTMFFKYNVDSLALPSLDSLETLLYDFNLQSGDSCIYGSYTTYVNQTDSVLINGTYRKRQYGYRMSNRVGIVHYSSIEGIGSESGFFGNTIRQFECGSALQCFKDNEIYYSPNNYGSNSCLTNIDKPEKEISISILPNPAADRIKIDVKDIDFEGNFQIYTIQGILINEIDVYKSQNGFEINISNLPSGFYLGMMKYRNGNYSSVKFVKE